jgi:hypothetical protein
LPTPPLYGRGPVFDASDPADSLPCHRRGGARFWSRSDQCDHRGSVARKARCRRQNDSITPVPHASPKASTPCWFLHTSIVDGSGSFVEHFDAATWFVGADPRSSNRRVGIRSDTEGREPRHLLNQTGTSDRCGSGGNSTRIGSSVRTSPPVRTIPMIPALRINRPCASRSSTAAIRPG